MRASPFADRTAVIRAEADLDARRTAAARPAWQTPPGRLSLAGADVHVWRAWLDPPADRVEALAVSLSADEWKRADRLAFAHLRRRYVVGRGVLRAILGRYTGAAPARLRFRYAPGGKPALDDQPGGADFRFNISHSNELLLCAVALDREVGVDVEWTGRPLPDAEQIAQSFFSAAERAALRAVPAHLKTVAFFNCWTRKEAYIKARGDGLSLPLDSFDVSLAPGAPVALTGSRRGARDPERWQLRAFEAAPGYCAALVVEGRPGRISFWEFPTRR